MAAVLQSRLYFPRERAAASELEQRAPDYWAAASPEGTAERIALRISVNANRCAG